MVCILSHVAAVLTVISFAPFKIHGFPNAFHIQDEQVVLHRRIGDFIPIQLVFLNEDDHQRARNLSLRLCLTVNGKECTCCDDFLEAGIRLESKCTSDAAHWFAVTLTSKAAIAVGTDSQSISVTSYPIHVPPIADGFTSEAVSTVDTITLVLPLTLDDLSRSAVLFNSLQPTRPGVVWEMLIFVPDHQHTILDTALMGFQKTLPFPVRVMKESILFRRKQPSKAVPYAIQMAIKLLAAQIVTTEFYLTLDADVVLLRPFHTSDIILVTYTDDGRRRPRALYEHEGRFLHHPHWWEGSERLLGMPSKYPLRQGYGVTPALMSTFGSLLTVASVETALATNVQQRGLQKDAQCVAAADMAAGGGREGNETGLVCSGGIDDKDISEAAEALWLDQFGLHDQIWSEYTLYRVALDHFQVRYAVHLSFSCFVS